MNKLFITDIPLTSYSHRNKQCNKITQLVHLTRKAPCSARTICTYCTLQFPRLWAQIGFIGKFLPFSQQIIILNIQYKQNIYEKKHSTVKHMPFCSFSYYQRCWRTLAALLWYSTPVGGPTARHFKAISSMLGQPHDRLAFSENVCNIVPLSMSPYLCFANQKQSFWKMLWVLDQMKNRNIINI